MERFYLPSAQSLTTNEIVLRKTPQIKTKTKGKPQPEISLRSQTGPQERLMAMAVMRTESVPKDELLHKLDFVWS